MQIGEQLLLVVGDRVLVKPEDANDRTKVGLYLPQSVAEKEPVQAGRILEIGPGHPVPDVTPDTREPWEQNDEREPRYVPLQARMGDYALFLRKEAVEVVYKNQKFLVVPQAAILLLIRDANPDLPIV